MTDRRSTPANARAALETLRGQVDAPVYTAGDAAQVILPLADLLAGPGGARAVRGRSSLPDASPLCWAGS